MCGGASVFMSEDVSVWLCTGCTCLCIRKRGCAYVGKLERKDGARRQVSCRPTAGSLNRPQGEKGQPGRHPVQAPRGGLHSRQ